MLAGAEVALTAKTAFVAREDNAACFVHCAGRMVYFAAAVFPLSWLAGDKNKVKIGAHVHIGDKAVINTVGNVDTGFSAEVAIESWVVIEPGAVLTSCMIGNR